MIPRWCCSSLRLLSNTFHKPVWLLRVILFLFRIFYSKIFQTSGRTKTHITKRWRNVSLRFQMLSMFGSDATKKKHPFASTKSAEKAKNLFVFFSQFLFKKHKNYGFVLNLKDYDNERWVRFNKNNNNKWFFHVNLKTVGQRLLFPTLGNSTTLD